MAIAPGFWAYDWGDIASLAGLCVSVATLVVARRAKRAADEAKAEIRSQNLLAEFEGAQRKAEQVGLFIAQQKWEIVQLRAQEVVSACSAILRRWGPPALTEGSRNAVFRAQGQYSSIARAATLAARHAPSGVDYRAMADSQQKAFRLLSEQEEVFRGEMDRRSGRD